jgi:hypothetical protein
MMSFSLLEAAKLTLSQAILHGDAQNVSTLLGDLLSHSSYEVRFVTLKSIAKIFHSEDQKMLRLCALVVA